MYKEEEITKQKCTCGLVGKQLEKRHSYCLQQKAWKNRATPMMPVADCKHGESVRKVLGDRRHEHERGRVRKLFY